MTAPADAQARALRGMLPRRRARLVRRPDPLRALVALLVLSALATAVHVVRATGHG